RFLTSHAFMKIGFAATELRPVNGTICRFPRPRPRITIGSWIIFVRLNGARRSNRANQSMIYCFQKLMQRWRGHQQHCSILISLVRLMALLQVVRFLACAVGKIGAICCALCGKALPLIIAFMLSTLREVLRFRAHA